MNVSSVKNLNGETFSAVQDAALTDVVQTNSGNWQDITAYQNASAGYLTAHQSLDGYYTTADANTMSGMLSGAIDYVSANAGGGSTYSAGNGIDITDDTISVDTTVIPDISAVSAMIDAASANGNLFIAEYGVTTRQEVDAAYNAGKYIVCYESNNNSYLPLTYLYQNVYRFNRAFNVRENDGTPYCTKSNLSLYLDSTWHMELIPANADWNETNTNNISYIANKPDLSEYLTTAIFGSLSGDWEDTTDVVQTNSASWGQGGGSTPTYDGFSGLIDTIDSSGLFALSAGNAQRADVTNRLSQDGTMGKSISYYDGSNQMFLNPNKTPFGTTSGIYGPLYYATGAVITYGSSSNSAQYFGGFLKGNEWYISDATIGQALRGEVHRNRGVHLSGATSAGTSFDLSISAVSGKNDTTNGYNWKLERGCVSGKGMQGEWRYGPAEDTALRTVSALEYNAVDEISGIAGSAIAQYGAEKQWLQHDDTIVHVANSAQYAFGVNVSALQQLMGIDETVLWEGTRTSAVTLSEPASSFEKISIVNTMGSIITVQSDRYYIGFCNNISNDSNCYWCVGRFVLNGTSLTVNKSKAINIGSWTSTATTLTASNNWDYGTNIITKVVGIHRIA